jgi:hypothetical protein
MERYIMNLKQDLLNKVLEIVYLENGHHKIATATINSETINKLGGEMKDIDFEDMNCIEFYDFNDAKWQSTTFENILDVRETDILV